LVGQVDNGRPPTESSRFILMSAALDINIPNYASAIVSAKEIVDSISSL